MAAMEEIAVFLLILCSFLNRYFTSACNNDAECGTYYRCCKGRHSDHGSCINRDDCYGFCLENNDCSAPEICNTYQFLCTTECSYGDCHDGYICDNGHCVLEDSNDSEFDIGSVIGTIVVVGALVCVLACCLMKRGRSSDQGRDTGSTIVYRNRTSRGTNIQRNGEAERLEMSLIVEEPVPHNVQSSDQIPDPIAESAPPSYVDVNSVNSQPETPPPSYDEVMRFTRDSASQ